MGAGVRTGAGRGGHTLGRPSPCPPPRQVPAYAALRARGRQLRQRLQQLLDEEAALDERFYLKALQLPNRTHPAAVRGDGVGGGGRPDTPGTP